MDWRTFFDDDHPLYVNARHRALHADLVARGTIAMLPTGTPVVLDWGCGQAEGAALVAARCARLFLYDSAPRVRESLRRHFGDNATVAVLDDGDLGAVAPESLDAVVIVSVVQYLSRETFDAALAELVPKLRREGRLILADVIPRGLSPVVDARALLAFGWRGGFFLAALAGLVRTLFSNYSRLRSTLGITQWREDEIIVALAAHGLTARRAPENIGHNGARMTFVASRT